MLFRIPGIAQRGSAGFDMGIGGCPTRASKRQFKRSGDQSSGSQNVQRQLQGRDESLWDGKDDSFHDSDFESDDSDFGGMDSDGDESDLNGDDSDLNGDDSDLNGNEMDNDNDDSVDSLLSVDSLMSDDSL